MYAELSQAQKRRIRKTLRLRTKQKPVQPSGIELLFTAPCLCPYEAAWFRLWQTKGLRIKYLEMGN